LDKLTEDDLHAGNQSISEPLVCAGDERSHGWSFDCIRQLVMAGKAYTYLQRQENPHDSLGAFGGKHAPRHGQQFSRMHV
jgi:hypothetical protein